jgi:hypothetical protein
MSCSTSSLRLAFPDGKSPESGILGDDKTPGSKNQVKKQRKMQLLEERNLRRTRERGLKDAGAAHPATPGSCPSGCHQLKG